MDEFEQTRRSAAEEGYPVNIPHRLRKLCSVAIKIGRVEEVCRRKREDVGGRSSCMPRCYQCRQIGHLSNNSPARKGSNV